MLRKVLLVGLMLTLSACGGDGSGGAGDSGTSGGGGASPGSGPVGSKIDIQPMTTVNVDAGTGYFQDPYPIQTLTSDSNRGLPVFSGTNQQTISCSGDIKPGCFVSAPISLDPGTFTQQTAAVGSTINNFENLNIYQDTAGNWQMAVTAHLTKPGLTPWNIILHAHPTVAGAGMPTAWTADKLLVGALNVSAPNNYDGKYFEDSGTLYLVYNKKVGDEQDGVVAQEMASPTQRAVTDAVTLLGPETIGGGYNSELASGLNQSNTVRLIETGNITKINGKYVMTYSDGMYNLTDYKAGIAYSDTFLPAPGSYYRRVQKLDTNGVWGQANHAEVLYLLQSQIAAWPNYVASQVLAPGVPAIVRDGYGAFYLTFAGYDPLDAPLTKAGLLNGTHRRPYYIKLNVQIPTGGSVVNASSQDLASWVSPAL